MEKVGTTKAFSSGTSIYARIPAPICALLGIEKGTPLNIYKEGSIVIFDKVNEINKRVP